MLIGLPMVAAAIARRSTAALTQLALGVVVALGLWALNPDVGVAAGHYKPCPVGAARQTLDGWPCSSGASYADPWCQG